MKYKLTMDEARKIAHIKAMSKHNLNNNSGVLFQDVNDYCAEYDQFMMYLVDQKFVALEDDD